MTAPHERLRARLGDPALYLDDPADTARYARDWIGKYAGTAPLVVRPRSTEEVAAVLAACAELHVPVVLARRHGLRLADISSTVFPYPTMAEGLKRTADAYQRGRLAGTAGKVLRGVVRWLK